MATTRALICLNRFAAPPFEQMDMRGGTLSREWRHFVGFEGHAQHQCVPGRSIAAVLQPVFAIPLTWFAFVQSHPDCAAIASNPLLGRKNIGRVSRRWAVRVPLNYIRQSVQESAHSSLFRGSAVTRAVLGAGSLGDGCKSQASRKQCIECERLKLLIDFKVTKTSADGLTDSCRACLAVCQAKRLGNELGHLDISVNEAWERAKTCPHCRHSKGSRDFVTDRSKRDGLSRWCRGCLSAKLASRPKNEPQGGPQRCRHCQEVKPAVDFYVAKKHQSGLRAVCKLCFCKLAKGVYLRKRAFAERAVAPRVEKRCQVCKKMKEADEFSRNVGAADGLASLCRTCKTAEVGRYRAKRKEAAGLLKEAEAGASPLPRPDADLQT